MKILDIGEARYLIHQELGTDVDQAKIAQGIIGGILIRDSRSNNFFLCSKIEEADIDEINEDQIEGADS